MGIKGNHISDATAFGLKYLSHMDDRKHKYPLDLSTSYTSLIGTWKDSLRYFHLLMPFESSIISWSLRISQASQT